MGTWRYLSIGPWLSRTSFGMNTIMECMTGIANEAEDRGLLEPSSRAVS